MVVMMTLLSAKWKLKGLAFGTRDETRSSGIT